MPKQYTFRTTNDTFWIELVLDSVVDRSEFIREMMIEGMHSKGITSEVVLQNLTKRDTKSDEKSDKVRLSQSVQKTVIYSYNKGKDDSIPPRPTRYVSTRVNIDAIKSEFSSPSIQAIDEEVDDIDLDSKLDSLYE